MLEQLTLPIGEIARSSHFVDGESNIYVLLVSRDAEDELLDKPYERIQDLPLAEGAKQLATELQDHWNEQGVAGFFQIVGRLTPDGEEFEPIRPEDM